MTEEKGHVTSRASVAVIQRDNVIIMVLPSSFKRLEQNIIEELNSTLVPTNFRSVEFHEAIDQYRSCNLYSIIEKNDRMIALGIQS